MDDAADQNSQYQLRHWTRRPAAGAAILLIGGILLHRLIPDIPAIWLTVCGATVAVAMACLRWRTISTAALSLALITLGAAVAQLEDYHFPAGDISAYTAEVSRLAEIELTIDQPPRVLYQTSPAGRALPPRQIASGTVRRIRTKDGWRDSSGHIQLQINPPLPTLEYGQRIAALGMLSSPAPATNPGQFDWQRYYRDQRILASFSIPQASGIRIIAPGDFSPLQWLRQRARRALEAGFSPRQSTDHALLRALLLGDNDPELRDIQAQFIRTGTSHHLSISGMHVAVLGGVVFFFCRLLRLSPRKSAVFMMAFVVLYGLVALPAPPVIRSIILCLSLGIGIILRRSVDGIQLLAFTIFAMLLFHPLDLYNAGFQLSFGTVLGLMLYANRIAKRIDRKNEDEQVLIALGIAPTRMQSIRNWLKDHLIKDISTGIAAWAVSAPLIVQHFDQVNPWSIAAGLLLAIPVFASMVGGLVKIVLTLFLPWFAPAWAWLAAIPVEAMRLMVGWLAKIPGSDVALPALPVLLVLFYYVLLILPLLPVARPRLRFTFRAGALAACLAALLLPVIFILWPHRAAGLKMTLLSIGAGQCAVVELPSGKTILIDAGSSSIDDLERRCLEPFLRHEGVRQIDSIFISHANFDHFSAVAQAAEDYGVREVLVTPMFKDHAAKNYPARLMLRKLSALKCPLKQTTAGQNIELEKDCRLEILWPPEGEKLDANNSCQVMRLTYQGKSILFTGDVQAPAETALLSEPDHLKSDVLIAPHHGSLEASTEKFLEAIDAKTILASNDSTLSGKQRAFDELVTDRPLLRTHNRGAITVTISPQGALTISTFLNH